MGNDCFGGGAGGLGGVDICVPDPGWGVKSRSEYGFPVAFGEAEAPETSLVCLERARGFASADSSGSENRVREKSSILKFLVIPSVTCLSLPDELSS
jgi:hypothetical protein